MAKRFAICDFYAKYRVISIAFSRKIAIIYYTVTRFFFILIFPLMLCSAGLYAIDTQTQVSVQDFSKGPLFGKNLYIPFLIHYNFPSLPARSGERYDLQYHVSIYYAQDARYRTDIIPDDLYSINKYDTAYVVRDYESCVAELGVAYNILRQLQIGMDTRLISYYGGFLDPFIESFHNLFGFSNGDREKFRQNQIYINTPSDNGVLLFLNKNAVSFGDIDLWGKWTFFESGKLSLAALAAFKLPTGSLKSLSGSGYPDAAAGLLLDFRAARFLSLYAQAGIVVPFNGKSRPMFNGLFGVEIHPWKILSFNLQMNVKTSPLSDSAIPFGWNNVWGTDWEQLSLPQTNVLAGVVLRMGAFRFQIYIEEDAIFNQSNDFTIGVTLSRVVNLRNKLR